ncbi:hypothetical protein LIER_06033 [Lithospermum erythrorhizon]|uniref:MADS-box domain-containing protein n=1 Tax=Lithospermum erythrorhizon TaxID=34254 RepID=A0AAV3P6V2_LITER
MARLKVAKGFITNDKSRSLKFAKRKQCLIKKITELSTLCDVRVGLILYEDKGNSNNSPEIFPEDPQAIEHLINKYREQPRADSKRWNTNLSTVMKSWKMKAEIDITKLQESMVVKEPTSPLLSHPSFDGTNLEDLSQGQLEEYGQLIDKHIENVNKAYECKKTQQKKVGKKSAARPSQNVDITTQAVAQPTQILDNTMPAPPPRVQIPPPIAVQQTIFNHPYHPMQYNMQLGALYEHQSIMPFVYPQNVSIPTTYQVNETSNFNDGFYNQMEPAASLSSSFQYDHHLHHAVGQYSMWYPPGNPKQPMVPYMQYYPGMLPSGDLAKWQMKYSSEGNFGPKNFPPC